MSPAVSASITYSSQSTIDAFAKKDMFGLMDFAGIFAVMVRLSEISNVMMVIQFQVMVVQIVWYNHHIFVIIVWECLLYVLMRLILHKSLLFKLIGIMMRMQEYLSLK